MSPDKQNAPGTDRGVRRSAQRTADGVPMVAHRPPNVALLDDHRPGALVAWAKARAHLLDSCLWPLVPVDVERALKRRGWW